MKHYSIDIESTKMARKLRAIAMHSNELADELESIENEWQCDCGSSDYSDYFSDKPFVERVCNKCHERYAVQVVDDLPTHLEDSKSKNECVNLSDKQIEMISGMIKRNEKGMAICECDIQRVLEGSD